MRQNAFRPASTFAFLLLPTLAFAQQSDVEKVIALGKSDSRVMEHLDHLANRIGPRLTGSDGFTNACAWTREQFEAFGLANARLEKWGEFPVGFNRGPSSGRMVAPESRELTFATNAWTAGTHGPTKGTALLAPTNEQELEALKGKLAGAWILSPPSAQGQGGRPQPPASGAPVEAGAPSRGSAGSNGSGAARGAGEAPARGAGDGSSTPARGGGEGGRGAGGGGGEGGRGPGGGGTPAERAFRDKLEKAYDEAGVAGTIRSGRGDLVLTGGSSRVDFAKLPQRASITMLAADFDAITEKLKAGQTVQLEFDIRNWFEKGPIELSNVIAEIPGTTKPDEVVIVSGHLDSWDGATGTTDNGTGCATTMEAARLLVKAGVKPKRTIRFILWGGEEQGLLGSAAYVKAHKDEMEKISAVLVHDGGTNFCAGITATPPMVKPFEEIFAPVANLDPELPFKVREVKGLSGGGSDHNSFLAANVPGFFWSQRGRANYNHTHHTQFDTFDAAIPEYQRNSAIVIAVGALGIANLPELLSRENLRAPGGGGGGRRLGATLGDDMTITEVSDDGLAAKAGLLVGDKLVKIGDSAVADNDEMRTALREGPAKTKVVVLRKGKEVEVAIEFPVDTSGAGARRLGVRLGDGMTIDVITPGSAGDQAGFVAGDKLLKVGDKSVSTAQELADALADATGEVKVTVLRDGKEVVVTAKLG